MSCTGRSVCAPPAAHWCAPPAEPPVLQACTQGLCNPCCTGLFKACTARAVHRVLTGCSPAVTGTGRSVCAHHPRRTGAHHPRNHLCRPWPYPWDPIGLNRPITRHNTGDMAGDCSPGAQRAFKGCSDPDDPDDPDDPFGHTHAQRGQKGQNDPFGPIGPYEGPGPWG